MKNQSLIFGFVAVVMSILAPPADCSAVSSAIQHLDPVQGQILNRTGIDLGKTTLQLEINSFIPGGAVGNGQFAGDSCSSDEKITRAIPVRSGGTFDVGAIDLKNSYSDRYCWSLSLVSGKYVAPVFAAEPVYLKSQGDYQRIIGKLFVDPSVASAHESFTVRVPNGWTISQYVQSLVAGLPYSDATRYDWELTLSYTYKSTNITFSPVSGDLIPAFSEVPFGNALANSTIGKDMKSFKVTVFDPANPFANLHVSNDAQFQPVTEFTTPMTYYLQLNFWNKLTAARDEVFEPIPNPRDFLEPDSSSDAGVILVNYGGFKTGVKTMEDYLLTLNPILSDVKHTACCDTRGLWMLGHL